MKSEYGVTNAETHARYYGVRATLVIPPRFSSSSEKQNPNLCGYVALVNPLGPNDSGLKVGVSRCGALGVWTLYVWSPLPHERRGFQRGMEVELLMGKAYEFDLRFAQDDHKRFELRINGCVIWREVFAMPISKTIYENGGLRVQLSIGASNDCGATSFDQMRWCKVFGAVDSSCQTWKPFTTHVN
jgi:hypothetical protein